MSKVSWIIVIVSAVIILGGGFSYWYFKIHQPAAKITTSSSSSPTSVLNSPSPVSTSSSSVMMTVKIFLIAPNDNGKSGKAVGCGDSVVPVDREIPQTQAVLKASIEELIGLKDRDYGQSGLVNDLSGSNLKFVSASVDNSGHAIVKLTGTLSVNGVCDGPRIKAQFEETALQFTTVKNVDIFINDKNLNDILSQKD